jgi:hypothetical protein
MRVATDGYIDIRDERRVRTPGFHDDSVEPMPEGEALAFLLSHSFPGHRRMVRSLSTAERRQIRLAAWADSVSERMALVDRVWRAITEPMVPLAGHDGPQFVQVVQYGHWAWPMYLDGATTRALPHGGIPIGEMEGARKTKVLRLDRKTA